MAAEGTIEDDGDGLLQVIFYMEICLPIYALNLKGLPGTSRNRIVGSSVCLSAILSRLQTKCNILRFGDDTVTKIGL